MMPVQDQFVVRPAVFQIARLEPVVSFVVGGGTSAVLLRGAPIALPPGAVLAAPIDSTTFPTT